MAAGVGFTPHSWLTGSRSSCRGLVFSVVVATITVHAVCCVSCAADERGEEGPGVGQPAGHPAEVGRGDAG